MAHLPLDKISNNDHYLLGTITSVRCSYLIYQLNWCGCKCRTAVAVEGPSEAIVEPVVEGTAVEGTAAADASVAAAVVAGRDCNRLHAG